MADTYNGWTNYETWAVKLWIDNDEGTQEHWREEAERCIADTGDKHPNQFMDADGNRRTMLASVLSNAHESMAEEWMQDQSSIFADLLNAALSDVNWREIAQSMLDDADEVAENDR
jgi:hypothetical protein